MEFYKGQHKAVEKLMKQVMEEKCDYFRFTISDLQGVPRGKMTPVRHLQDSLENGLGILNGVLCLGIRGDALETQEEKDGTFDNCLLIAEPDGFQRLPWAGGSKYKVCQILCEPHWLDGSYMEATPRYIARKQLSRLEELGYSLLSAAELEFQVVDGKTRKLINDGMDIYNQTRLAEHEELLIELEQKLYGAGIDIEDIEIEYGNGQFEMTMKPARGVLAADQAFLLKQGVKEICIKNGLRASFMAKAFPGFVGDGFHFNHSLWNVSDNKNAFYDASKTDKLSDLARYWIGGIMKHLGSICLLLCPTLNCYRRLHQPWAPDICNWGVGNRLATVRVKSLSESATYVENRLATGSANAYLVLASTCAAGIDGIVNKIEPPVQNDKGARKLPASLQEAIEMFKEDTFIKDVFGDQFVRWFLESKAQDIALTGTNPSDPKENEEEAYAKERERYFDFL